MDDPQNTHSALIFTTVSQPIPDRRGPGLYGYPGVALAAGTPVTQVGLAASETPTPPRQLVTLTAGGVANALLRVVDAANYPPSKCAIVPTKSLRIYPPNQTVPVYLHYSTQMCGKPVQTMSVSVVQPGNGGNA